MVVSDVLVERDSAPSGIVSICKHDESEIKSSSTRLQGIRRRPYQCGPDLNATPFCGISQSAPSGSGPAASNQISQGMHQGISDLRGTQG